MTKRSTPDDTWLLGNCSQTQKWRGPGTYTESCCLSKGVHTLTCKTSRAKTDWSSNVVMVMGHRFCEDFVGYEAVFSINISGVFIYGKIWKYMYLMNLLHSHFVNLVLLFFSPFNIRIIHRANHRTKRTCLQR